MPARRWPIWALLLLGLTTTPARAGVRLGENLEELRATYAHLPTSLHGATHLQNVDFAGVHWTDVRFETTSGHQLQSIVLRTRSVAYETLKQEVASALADAGGDAIAPNMQVRLCEDGDGSVTLTYEGATASV